MKRMIKYISFGLICILIFSTFITCVSASSNTFVTTEVQDGRVLLYLDTSVPVEVRNAENEEWICIPGKGTSTNMEDVKFIGFSGVPSGIVAVSFLYSESFTVTSYTYSDIPQTHWAYDSIIDLSFARVLNGKGSEAYEYFDLKGNVRVTEFGATLYRLAGTPELEADGVKLADTLEEKWYTDAMRWCAASGITYAVKENADTEEYGRLGGAPAIDKSATYSVLPDSHSKFMTRSDIVTSLYYYVSNYLGKSVDATADLSVFADWSDDTGAYLEKSMTVPYEALDADSRDAVKAECAAAWSWAVDVGIINGFEDGLLRPDANLNRAQYAVILDRFLEYIEGLS